MPPKKRSPKEFTASEVGTLVESLRNDIGAIADGVADIRKEVDGFKGWRAGASEDLGLLKTGLRELRTELTAFDSRLKIVEAKVGL